ncbi:DUF4494 family protein [Prevotellamassilia timonensis]|uniref:DUF4494 family protein n=1 Tax=Prevotellamassilia timonensis TaxID=1852370 RepID=UPI00307A80FE
MQKFIQTIECSVRYVKLQPDGRTLDAREVWLVEARSYGEAQNRLGLALSKYAQDGADGLFVQQMKSVYYAEHLTDEEAAKQRYWRVRVKLTDRNPDTGKESSVTQQWLVRADTMGRATKLATETMGDSCEMVAVTELKYNGYIER